MNLIKSLLVVASLMVATTAIAQTNTTTDKRDSLPADAIIVKRVPLESKDAVESKEDVLVVDTIPSSSEGLNIVLYNDNTWQYVRNRNIDVLDETIYTENWNTKIQPYDVELNSLPISMVIDLVDSLKSYHYPFKGRVTSKYGPRRSRIHQGTDIDLETGDPVYATFDGRVRVTTYVRGGYGNLVIIRHDNGLETYYGHLSEISVEPDEWVTAGQIIGKGGNTGRSTGSHLHFEMRYKGHTFDPERLIDFTTGTLRRETFLLKRTYFSPYSRFTQDFEEEIQSDEEDKKIAAEAAAVKYHIVKRGDTLSRIAVNNQTTVTKLCQLNGINRNSVLRIGQRIRVR